MADCGGGISLGSG